MGNAAKGGVPSGLGWLGRMAARLASEGHEWIQWPATPHKRQT